MGTEYGNGAEEAMGVHQPAEISRMRGGAPIMANPLVGLLSESSLAQLVNTAFRNYQSTLALSRSPLANTTLISPTLVLDDVSPTAEERGRGLRLLLRWAVEQIAPAPPAYPLGAFRPFDDPTWSDPLWWRYNILRHRYVEPLHPDDFIGGRYTETLLALTGIASSDAFFDERNRAIQEVAERLRQQLLDGAGNQTLQQMALSEAVRLLEEQSAAAKLLGIAATFDDVFPRTLLLTMADAEQIRQPAQVLDGLIANRLLLAGDAASNLWLAPTFRQYIYQRQPIDLRQRRHRIVARAYREQDAPLTTASHYQQAQLHTQAATLLLDAAETLIHEMQIADLIQTLERFSERQLPPPQWREIQILLSDLYYRSGQPAEALAACRQALKAERAAPQQARIYRRMGKLYEKRNQLHALGYYQQAVERFEPTNPELGDLLKDRGWLHILRRDWSAAEQDLTLAQSIIMPSNAELRADIDDALASLYRRQKRYDQALEQAQEALALREQLGNLPRIAASFNNIGNIYRHMGEYGHAISAYEEALTTYRKLGNQEATAGALMNMGNAYFQLQRLDDAIQHHLQSLEICLTLGQPHVEATVRYNLAEAYAARQCQSEALVHWQQGYDLSQRAGFTDEIGAFEQLRAETPLLQQERPSPLPAAPLPAPTVVPTATTLAVEEQTVLTLMEQTGRLTAKELMSQLTISRATATRRLTTLTEAGYLLQHGKGRGTYYTLAPTPHAAVPPAAATASDVAGTALTIPDLLARLHAHDATLHERFAVAALEAPSPDLALPMQRILVRFQTTPTLAEFCALRTYLEAAVGAAFDLWPILPSDSNDR